MDIERPIFAEKPRIRSDPPPRPMGRIGSIESTLLRMCVGEWTMLTHMQAKSLQRAAKRRGGAALRYKTSDLFSVVKITKAPWMDDALTKPMDGPSTLEMDADM